MRYVFGLFKRHLVVLQNITSLYYCLQNKAANLQIQRQIETQNQQK